MNKKRAVLIIVILFGLVGLRFIMVFSSSTGGGHSVDSPNGLYNANAGSFDMVQFWGSHKEFYDFWVTYKDNGKRIKIIRLERFDDTPQFTMRGEKIISWSSDSSAVTFAFQDIELKLEVRNDDKSENNQNDN